MILAAPPTAVEAKAMNAVWRRDEPHRNFCVKMVRGDVVVTFRSTDHPDVRYEVYANARTDTLAGLTKAYDPATGGWSYALDIGSSAPFTGRVCLGVATSDGMEPRL